MKKKIIIGNVLFIMMLSMVAVINYYKYRQIIGDLRIVHYIAFCSENLDYMTLYLNVVLPEEKYHENLTMNLIRLYVIVRNEKVPNQIGIVIYDSMESLKTGESYAEKTFDKQ